VSSDAAAARLRALTDLATPWAVRVAATLRLPEHVEAGATKLEELAARAGADAGALARLLRLLCARGVFEEVAPGEFRSTDLARLLQGDDGARPWLDLDGAPGLWAESWAQLLTAVRTGSPGRDEGWYYEELAATGRGESFDALMAAQVTETARTLAVAFDWSGVGHVVDVGGGTGALLRELLDAQPHLRATLFDLPQVVRAAAAHERLEVVAGDFFADPLPAADVYVLSEIVHGWRDDDAVAILRRCAEAGGEAARILLLEQVVPEEPPPETAAFDLFMLTLVGGHERTLEEFRRLAASVGLTVRRSWPLRTAESLLELA
jgi:SAM-dependent methyltransferase